PYIYVSGSSRGLYIINASDPTRPFEQPGGHFETAGLGNFIMNSTQVVGNLMVSGGANSGKGFATYDLSDPLNPELADKITPDNFTYTYLLAGVIPGPGQHAVDAGRLYLYTKFFKDLKGKIEGSGFAVYDVTDPSDIKTLPAPGNIPTNKIGYGN